MENKRIIGTAYERMAAAYLEQKGYQILEYNFRCGIGEVDLIAKDGEYIVFIEVKYRKNQEFGSPAEAVTKAKQRTLSKVADYYIVRNKLPLFFSYRFDVVTICGESMAHYKNAFFYQ